MAIEKFKGYCPICESQVVFIATEPWYRDFLKCPSCSSVPRERALSLRVKQLFPEWKRLAIHEIGPAMRGFAVKLKSECPVSLVTKSYGYDIGERIAEWTPFDVEITRYWDRTSGIIGSYTEVVVCRKPLEKMDNRQLGAQYSVSFCSSLES